jgi:hypothetical protein
MAKNDGENVCPGVEMVCPGCRRPVKVPRIQTDPDKPLVCGGCGQRFDCNDLSALERPGGA